MTTNVGTIDRIARVIVGLALVAWALGFIPGLSATPWAWIGLVPLITGLVGTCPAYSLIGVDTCKRG